MLSRIRINRKLTLLCAVFTIPVAFLVFLFVAQTEKDVDFAKKELAGVDYFVLLRDELSSLIAVSQEFADIKQLQRSQAAVLDMDGRNAEKMNAADSANAAAEAVREAAKAPSGVLPDAALDAVMDHITKVEDGSNLTLDPDLDSFYIQDLVTVKIPTLAIACARSMVAGAVLLSQPEPSPESVVAFLTHKGELASALSGLQSDITSGQRGNPDGSIGATLSAGAESLNSKAAAYGKLLDQMMAPSASDRPSLATIRQAQRDTQQAVETLWNSGISELGQLLHRRIDALRWRMTASLALTATVFLGSLALAAKIAASIGRPLKALRETMHSIVQGNTALTASALTKIDPPALIGTDPLTVFL